MLSQLNENYFAKFEFLQHLPLILKFHFPKTFILFHLNSFCLEVSELESQQQISSWFSMSLVSWFLKCRKFARTRALEQKKISFCLMIQTTQIRKKQKTILLFVFSSSLKMCIYQFFNLKRKSKEKSWKKKKKKSLK